MSAVILSADIGTSSLKAAFIDFDGNLKAFDRETYPLGSPAMAWEQAFIKALERLREQTPHCKIEAICISGNGPTLVPVSGDGEALPPLYWYDGRVHFPTEGKNRSFFLPHAAWLKEKAQAEYQKVKFFFSSHEWLAYRLGAEVFTVLPQTGYIPYYWDDEQCRLFGLDREKFPPFVNTGSVMGKVASGRMPGIEGGLQASILSDLANNAMRIGLKSGTPIIAGGPDFITALIGTGTMKSGDVCDRAGSSEGINVCASSRPEIQVVKGKALRVLPHAKTGFWNIGAVIPSSGTFFESYRTGAGQENRSYEELLAELIPSANDVKIFSRALSGDLADHIESGRAVLCAIGFAVRDALETLEDSGFPIKAMTVSGGQSKNRLWNQLKADITGVSLMIPDISDGELAGNAVIAACALDTSCADETFFEQALERTITRMIRFRETFEPNAGTASFWQEHYEFYRSQKAKADISGRS